MACMSLTLSAWLYPVKSNKFLCSGIDAGWIRLSCTLVLRLGGIEGVDADEQADMADDRVLVVSSK
jgi:hypothetical protein